MADKHAVFGVLVLFSVCGAAASTSLGGEGDVTHLPGLIRDFKPDASEFMVSGSESASSVAGLVASELSDSGDPVFLGAGRRVTAPALDAQGRAIPPSLMSSAVDDFAIQSGSVLPGEAFCAQVGVLGAAISDGGKYDCPVTMRLRIGSTEFEPFGAFSSPTGANVNDGSWADGTDSLRYVVPGVFDAFTQISAEAESWVKTSSSVSGTSDSHWKVHMHANTWTGSSQVILLRNGDSVPNISGLYSQSSVASYVAPYTNPSTKKIELADNQIIYLFEIGNDASSPSADFQDLVLLVSLASDPSYFESGASASGSDCAHPEGDIPAQLGQTDSAGIESEASFSKWFRGVLGVNSSISHTLDLVEDAQGEHVFSTPDFTPIDGELYGNDGADHNRGFTMEIAASFSTEHCSGDFLQITGDLDAWVFVDGQLALDLGGARDGASQRLDIDRLDLSEGDEHEIKIFLAQRRDSAAFELRTNMDLRTSEGTIAQAAGALMD
ncbi:MAG: fibro-slime domain-containing protein [Phycisphaerales bacterium]